jgi:AraC-like DNA-binding protein
MSSAAYQEMAEIIQRFTPDDTPCETEIEGLFLSRRSSPTQPIHMSQWPCFAMVIQGEKTVTLGGEVHHYGVGDYLLVSLDLPVASRVTVASPETPHLGLGLAINPERLGEVLRRMTIARPVTSGGAMRGLAVVPTSTDLLDSCLRLLRLLDRPKDIPWVAPLVEQEILYRLLTGPLGPRLRQVMIFETPANSIARATAWLRENFRQQLRVSELADRVGMCLSTFHHQFKAVTAVSPLQFQKQLRLHEARRLMLIERLDASTASYTVGYESPSQFSREYSRLYGISPIRDMARMRTR